MILVVDGQRIYNYEYQEPPPIASNSLGFIDIEFRLSEEWDGYICTAQFVQHKEDGTDFIASKALYNNHVTFPDGIIPGVLEISLFGYKAGEAERGTTFPYIQPVHRSGFTSTEATPIPPTPDLYSQFLESFEATKQSIENNKQIVQNASKDAITARDDAVKAAKIAVAAAKDIQSNLDLIKSNAEQAITDIQTEGNTQRSSVTSTGDAQNQRVIDTGAEQLRALSTQGDIEQRKVIAAGDEQVSRVTNAGNSAVESVTLEKTNAINDVQNTKTEAVNSVESAKTEAVNSIKSAESAAIQNIGTGVDDTLSISGKAADAKRTGDSINALKDDTAALSGKLEKTEKRAERAEATARYAIKMQQGYTYDCKAVVGSGSEVDVPVGAKDYAGLRKIGGMSRKGYQVLQDDFPASSSQLNITKNGSYDYTLTTLSSGAYRQSYIKKAISGLAGMYTLRAKIVGTGGLIVRYRSAGEEEIGSVTVTSNAPERTINVSEDFTMIDLVFIGNDGKEVPIGSVTTISDIMLEPGNTAHQFEPYTADLIVASIDSVVSKRAGGEVIHTTALPPEMLALCPDYGQGTAESYNYIDFEVKSYHHVGSMTQNGVWTALETPEIIDLSAAWADDLELLTVASGGTVQMHYPKLDEGFELAVPSEIVFAVDIAQAVKE